MSFIHTRASASATHICIRMLSYVLVCYSYAHVCYSYLFVCHSYVLVCIRMELVCSLGCFSYDRAGRSSHSCSSLPVCQLTNTCACAWVHFYSGHKNNNCSSRHFNFTVAFAFIFIHFKLIRKLKKQRDDWVKIIVTDDQEFCVETTLLCTDTLYILLPFGTILYHLDKLISAV